MDGDLVTKLTALPIGFTDNIVPQKCWVPKCIFPVTWTPGTWSKCTLENGAFTICRIYPRTDVNCCYLDDCVTSRKFRMGKNRLSELEHLTPVEEQIAELEVVLRLNEKILRRKDLTLDKLKELTIFHLQHFMLVSNCHVQNADMQEYGIVEVKIIKATNCGEDMCFMIAKNTSLNISDVQLECPVNSSRVTFHKYGFEKPLQDLIDLLEIFLNPARSKSLPLNALLVGATGSGKSTLLQHFVEQTNCNLFSITRDKLHGQFVGETEACLRETFQSALLFNEKLKPKLPTIILIEDLHLLCPIVNLRATDSDITQRICSQLLTLVDELHRNGSRILCLASTSEPDRLNERARRAGRFSLEIAIQPHSEEQRKQLFKAMFQEQFSKQQLTATVLEEVGKHTQGYTIADLALLLRTISQKCLFAPQRNLSDIVNEALQQSTSSSVRNNDVSVYKILEGFESIGGMADLKRTLTISVLAGLQQQEAFERFGLTLPKGILLYGPPGCAKTTIAKCLAKEANMTFIATTSAEVYSPYIGCAEKFMAKLFDTARKNSPCLIFLDEIDSLVGRRSIAAAGSSCGDVQLRVLSTLLTEMDGIIAGGGGIEQHILVVAATNRPDMLDDALIRPGRFDKLIHVPAPDKASRLALLQLYSKRMPFAENVHLGEIAERTENYSGADLCNLCNEAAMHALTRNLDASEINMQDFEFILLTQKTSLTQKQIDWYYEFAKKSVM